MGGCDLTDLVDWGESLSSVTVSKVLEQELAILLVRDYLTPCLQNP